jgi:hypothetical protein
MGGLLLYLIGVWASSAYGPEALPRQVAAATARGHLPIAFASTLAGDLPLRIERLPDGARATYRPASAGNPEVLVLDGPTYVRGVRLIPVVDMPVDLGESYFAALLDAHLARALRQPAAPLAVELRRRAGEALPDVPPEQRVEAYVGALTSFGSHLLAVANELERKEIQRRDRGGLCPLLGRELPLLALWERIFTSEPYHGAYETPGGAARWSRAALRPEDKRFLLDVVLDSRWRGSVRGDLAPRYCRR